MTALPSKMTVAAALAIALGFPCSSQTPAASQPAATDGLLQGFEMPPNGARPRVWWHWMNGNISERGITLDLDWMHRVGVGGVTIFEGAINTPQVVAERLIYMTPAWKQAFNRAVSHAHELGMEVAIASSPGWSETGGPWVPPAQGMKKMVWSATRVEGGKPFSGALPQPPQVDGPFQNYRAAQRRRVGDEWQPAPEFYQDSAVVAYRIPEGDEPQSQLNPRVTSSGGTANVTALSDGDVEDIALDLPAEKPGSTSWIEFDYGHPQTIQAVTLADPTQLTGMFWHGMSVLPPRLEASDDGVTFRKVADIPYSTLLQRTIAFDAVTARYFRVVYETPADGKQPPDHHITELVLSSGTRVNEFEQRAGFAITADYFAITDPNTQPQFMVPESDVIDLTGKMQPDGTLDWTAPAGNWMVLRIGESLTGHMNGPAPAEATGLEVDKLNREFVKNYVDGYLDMYRHTGYGGTNVNTYSPSIIGKSGISFLLTDSIETGPQNWTDDMLEQFQKLRGYDPRPWLPALTGVVIGSTPDTDKFLWDFRRTIAQLLAENHYGEIADELHKNGMSYYSEALEFHRPMLGDDMEMRSHADVPMGAMWTWAGQPGPDVDYIADLRGAASVAHIYGQNLVGAESMTSRGPAWSFSPNSLKKVADLEFAEGVNRFEIHESTHQPVADMAPGLTLGPYGLWFNRNQTWADEAEPWVTYLSRCSWLLQQGHYYADVAYFYGSEGPLTTVFGWNEPKDAPHGYAYDYVNSDAILNHLSIKDGLWVSTGGTSYRLLYLGGSSQRITVPVLRKLRDMVAEGGVLVGNRPSDSPSLSDDPREFKRVIDELWGRRPAKPDTAHRLKKGRVYAGMTPDEALTALDVAKDFDYAAPMMSNGNDGASAENAKRPHLLFLHRKLDDGDLYFVDNREDRDESLDVTFRVDGKTPELWDAASGAIAPASYRIANGSTTIPLHLDRYGTIFVVFRKPAGKDSVAFPATRETAMGSLDTALNLDWRVTFQSNRGAPDQGVGFHHLFDWSTSPLAEAGIKYFSGTATYSKTFEIPAGAPEAGARYWLDLGDVENLAEVAVNGKYLGILWKTPFKVDVTDALQPGKNEIVIQVTNLWVNRMIGDQQPWSLKKYTFAGFNPYKADSPLLPSGLLGPVRLIAVTEQSKSPER